jgi:hypothetical protein
MASVKLEILRDGPPHNQLLSPLTRYLALCGDHAAGTVTVPFEHAEILERLRPLGYNDDSDEGRRRHYELGELGRDVGRLLEQIPGIVKDLADAVRRDGELTHLRLVLGANELALLPFELAVGPPGFPGAGEPLCLQSASPVCVTREIRRVAPPKFEWPRRAKVLFVTASPPGLPAVPDEAHLLVLREAIDPWVLHFPPDRDDQRKLHVGQHLSVLLRASARDISDACASGSYTHVHILAHGMPLSKGDARRFGIALHHDLDPTRADIIDGARLGAILRTHTREGDRDLACPAVVTLATCDSGNIGGVVAPGASVAHDLHRQGIPLVVASQFPLSYDGSVHLARLLYEPLLWGQDPRLVLDDVRRQLSALVPRRHDWASLVTYSALPTDLDYQLREVTFEQATRAIEAAMSHLDALLDEMSSRKETMTDAESEERIRGPIVKVEKAQKVLEHLRVRASDRAADIDGYLASALKRLAEFWARLSVPKSGQATAGKHRESRERADLCLRAAQHHYEKAFAAVGYSWALVQALALTFARTGDLDDEAWQLGWLLSKREYNRYTDERKTFAINNLVELALLACSRPAVAEAAGTQAAAVQPVLAAAERFRLLADPAKEASEWLERLLMSQPTHEWSTHSLRRQLRRYSETFTQIPTPVKNLATELGKRVDDVLAGNK